MEIGTQNVDADDHQVYDAYQNQHLRDTYDVEGISLLVIKLVLILDDGETQTYNSQSHHHSIYEQNPAQDNLGHVSIFEVVTVVLRAYLNLISNPSFLDPILKGILVFLVFFFQSFLRGSYFPSKSFVNFESLRLPRLRFTT
jgi:hypothetical protein